MSERTSRLLYVAGMWRPVPWRAGVIAGCRTAPFVAPVDLPGATPGLGRPARALRRELHRHEVAVAHLVVAPLQSQRAALARSGVAASRHQLVPRHHLGAHEAALDVGVDLAGRAPCGGAALDRMGARLLALAGGEERDQLEQLECRADHA